MPPLRILNCVLDVLDAHILNTDTVTDKYITRHTLTTHNLRQGRRHAPKLPGYSPYTAHAHNGARARGISSARASLSARPSARATPSPTRLRKVAASPVAVNRSSGAPTNSVSKGHANHRAKAWDSPGGMAEQRGRDPSMCAAAQLSNQGLTGSTNGAKGADSQDNQAHAGGQGAILNTRAASSGGSMGS